MARTRTHSRSRSRSRKPPVRQRVHWSVYLGVALLACGVIAIVIAALLTR